MNYHNITTDDMLNGDGLRVVLWCSGCEHRCPNCQNPITWDPNDGLLFDNEAMIELMNKLGKPYIAGLTLSGGDPMYPSNRDEVLKICRTAKELYPSKNIWMYTGYLFEDIKDEPILEYIDVLVDGPYIEALSDPKAHWVGSINQKIIDTQKTINNDYEIILYKS